MRYSDEKIKESLALWEYAKDIEPDRESINSLLVSSQEEFPVRSSIVIFKKYGILPGANLPSHYFIVVDGFIYHPGYNSETIYCDTLAATTQKVVAVEETCHYCLYKNMRRYFRDDMRFNILVRNCQIILRTFTEFQIILLTIFLLFMMTYSGDTALFRALVILIAIVCIYLHFKRKDFAHCPHIKYEYDRTNVSSSLSAAEQTSWKKKRE